MAELIAYLIEHFRDAESCLQQQDLGEILQQAGFNIAEIGNTLMLIEAIKDLPEASEALQNSRSLRVYTREEYDTLSPEIIGLLHYLDCEGALNPMQREFAVEALLRMPDEEVGIETAKMLALLITWVHQSDMPVSVSESLLASVQQPQMN